MKLPQTYQLHNIFLMLLGPLLIICILISGSYIVTTYKDVAYTKQKTFWSIVQLDRELAHTQVKVNEYIHDLTTAKSLEMSYNILWSRIPIAMNTLDKDHSLAQIENSSNITVLIDDLFVDVQRIEPAIVGQDKISKVALAVWSGVLKEHEEAIRGNLIHNLTSSNSVYAKQTTTTILKAATIPLFFVVCFFLYLSYLLSALWNGQQIKQKMLDHDSMTKLHSRDFMMNTLKELSETNVPFILLTFDLNKFKTVNDTLGHKAGDELLKHFARQLRDTLGKHGIAGRVGGDEFLWIIESTDTKLVNHYYGDFLLVMKKPCRIGEDSIQASTSTGGVVSTLCDNHTQCILEMADNAMYEAKRNKLKTIYWASQKTQKPDTPQTKKEHTLEQAL